jgi:hypothetical protein
MRIWAPCLEEELASCVALVFVFHNTLWEQNLIGGGDCWDKELLFFEEWQFY